VFFETTTNNIRRRVAMIGSVLIVSPMVVIVLAGWAVLQRVEQAAAIGQSAPETSEGASLSQLALNLVEVCRKYHQASVDTLKSAGQVLSQNGSIRLDASHMSVWHATNEVTGESKAWQIPLMAAGDVNFLPVPDFDKTAPAVDEIAKVMGTPATVFQRLNDSGDMLRVASSMKSDKGTRAIGTFVPAGGRDAESAKVLQTVLSGQTYLGKEVQRGVSYLTAFQPLKNSWGNVVGMLKTVLPEEQIKTQVKRLANVSAKNADKPQPFILEASGETRGTALLEGSNLWNEKDSSGRPYVQEMLARATHLAVGELAEYKFEKAARVGGIPKAMTAQIAYVPELDWVVGFSKPETQVRAALPAMQAIAWAMWSLFAVGVVSTSLAVRVWLKFSDDLAPQLNSLLSQVRKEAKQISAAAEPIAKPLVKQVTPSNASLVELLAAIDQITYATNHLMVTAATEAATSPTGGEAIAKAADEFRTLAQRCRKAAYDAVPPKNPLVEQEAVTLRRQAENLLRLAAGIDRTVEVATAEVRDD
jgi:methyl-accepting chemotaxis protein